ncbi:class I SAM-dependent DNA methyltransferase [Winogradskyella thalassocola]|uniref:site-specific DNA-methyltransferase (adenine-specific) n=1 Tax=Winogradskyella thalassocola TaxID=262004 RepID=A0A1G7ZM18_9FLAO|nr:DNA methyltransferase [Winogradskyella thalassocola]SDH09714.1 Type II restriction/modification system, DNA methylase subunit YeeA [Winogradskyella thalassocola]
MNASQIEKNVIALVENFNKDEFVFDLLKAYGISKTSITRLKKGDFNLSKVNGEVLYKSKMLFKEVESGTLLNTIDELTKDTDSLKHNPRFVIVTDYKTLLAKDIRTGLALDTPILEIHKHFGFFLPWAGQEKYAQKNENYADRKASYKMAKLYDILVTENPNIYDDGGHNLNIFLSRLLFCFFAEDTDIFPIEGMFTDTLEQHTQKDGSDAHTFLDRLFKVLNTKVNSKEAAHFKEFPYVNGGLFRNTIVSPKFTKEARKIIIECGDLDWSEINPDIFGSMIQAVVNPAYRSGLGMHYTSVPNIMKVIEPLFLNELNEEFEKHFNDVKKLNKLINRIAKIKVFDPACGSGNFLIIAYKQLRRLEIKILARIYEVNHQLNLGFPDVYTKIKLSQFYGIELDDFAHEMAILSLWLAEHQMNKEFVSELQDYGKAEDILPLKEAGNITQGNATRLNWEDTCPKNSTDEIYILGNPPYLGGKAQSKEQKQDMKIAFSNAKKIGELDYIACWFIKASSYINDNSSYCFVTTSSICQGSQVQQLWPHILRLEQEIGFAYTSFKWSNNAKNNAGVVVSIICVRHSSNKLKTLIDENRKKIVQNISPYLMEGTNTIVFQSLKPISKLPTILTGNSPYDGGNLILNKAEKDTLLSINEKSKKYIKKLRGSQDFLNGKQRWCLWINDEDVSEAKQIKFIEDRINRTKTFREGGGEVARGLVKRPHQFRYTHQAKESLIILPRVSSERRKYIPFGFLDSSYIVSDSAQAIYDPEPYVLGIILSLMHMTWVKKTGGYLGTSIRYSSALCYNTFPFPEISQKQKEQINLHVFEVLEEREKHSGKTLAQLYDPNKMPKGLKEAHHQLDLAIERCYRLKPFESDTERLEYLFKEYEKMINKNTLLEKPKRTRKKKA